MTERTRLDLMIDASQALWGPRPQTELKKAIGVNISTIQRWLNGQGSPSAEVSATLYPLVEARIEELQRLSNELRRDSMEKAKL